MEITGFVRKLLDVQSGSKKDGTTWYKRDFVVETEGGKFPKVVCVTAFGDKVDVLPKVGDNVKVDINIESKESNGKYFNNITLWKFEVLSSDNGYTPQSEPQTPATFNSAPVEDDLPF